MITLAPDNHLADLRLLTERDLETSMFETLEEFKDSVESSSFSPDESGYWACEYGGQRYAGPSVLTQRPSWATHVWWYGK